MSSTRFDVSNGIRKRVIYELVFLAIFEILLICLYFTPSEATSTNFVQVKLKAKLVLVFQNPKKSGVRYTETLYLNPKFDFTEKKILSSETKVFGETQ